jgi:hypothetical protein
MTVKRSVLFYRDFHGLTGGHLKVRDYFEHLQSSDLYAPGIYVTPRSKVDHPWRSGSILPEYNPDSADILFIAGLDWRALAEWKNLEDRKPVVNLIQHVCHALADNPRYEFLARRATRICVSEQVAQAVRQTGKCNGPIYTIPNGTDVSLKHLYSMDTQSSDVMVVGLKQPKLAAKLARIMRRRHIRVDCVTKFLEREEFLRRMAGARIVVTLPDQLEGFYLPALEAMALGKAVVCPDAVGNRGFCIDRVTALMPQPHPRALAASVTELLVNPVLEQDLIRSAKRVASVYTLERERSAFLEIMETLE